MQYFLTLLCFLLGAVQMPPNLLPWSEKSRLVWQDFRGRPADSSGHGAMIRAGLQTSTSMYKDTLTLTSKCVMDRNISWVKKNMNTPEVLEHEQIHFDITELQCRQIKKAVIEKGIFQKASVKADIRRILDDASISYVTSQRSFDKETSRSREVQIGWKAWVAIELAALDAYKGPQVKVRIE